MVNSGMVNVITWKKICGAAPVEGIHDHEGLITQTQAGSKDAPTHFELWIFNGKEYMCHSLINFIPDHTLPSNGT